MFTFPPQHGAALVLLRAKAVGLGVAAAPDRRLRFGQAARRARAGAILAAMAGVLAFAVTASAAVPASGNTNMPTLPGGPVAVPPSGTGCDAQPVQSEPGAPGDVIPMAVNATTPVATGPAEGKGGCPPPDPGGVISSPPQPPDSNPVPGDGALHVVPVPGVRDAHPAAIDHISLGADGRTLTVYWYGGVDTCYALAGVTTSRDADGTLVITVLEGTAPNVAPDTACIDLAMLKATTITLDTPLFRDGSQQPANDLPLPAPAE